MIPFQTTDWEAIPVLERKGKKGVAYSRTLQFDGIRVRMVEYSPLYEADHWCSRGHIVYCIDGEFTSHLQDGRNLVLKKGMSYQAGDGDANMHFSTTVRGCKLFVVDGNFLGNDGFTT